MAFTFSNSWIVAINTRLFRVTHKMVVATEFRKDYFGPNTKRRAVPSVIIIVPSPATTEALVIGLVIVTMPDLPLEQRTGITRVADRQLAAVPAQVSPLLSIENRTSSCVAPNVVVPLPWVPVASTY